MRRRRAGTHLIPNDHEGEDGVVVFVFGPFCAVGHPWIVLVALAVAVRPGTNEELDLRPVPLPQGELLAGPSLAFPLSPAAEEKQNPRLKSAHEDI